MILLATFFTFLGGQGQQAYMDFFFFRQEVDRAYFAISTLAGVCAEQSFQRLAEHVLCHPFRDLRERPKQLPRYSARFACLQSDWYFRCFIVSFMGQPIIDLLFMMSARSRHHSDVDGAEHAVLTLSTTYQNSVSCKDARFASHLSLLWATEQVQYRTGFMVLVSMRPLGVQDFQ
jgi:hypothetical protein